MIGGDQPGDPANVSHVNDGETHYHGPTEARCGQHGRENHQSDCHLPPVSTENGGIRLPQGDSHGGARR